jgi:5-carboxymethyl-2-hydroxymuconate isomerase
MPHVLVEYSANLEAEVEPMRLVAAVHRAVLSQPAFEVLGARTRAARREHFLVADGDPTHGFVAVTARIAPGRTLEARRQASQAILEALNGELESVYSSRGLLLSVEVTELDDSAVTRRNGLRERAAQEKVE